VSFLPSISAPNNPVGAFCRFSPPDRNFLATTAGKTAERTTILLVSVETTVEQGKILRIKYSLGAGGSAKYNHACAPALLLTQLSQTLQDNQVLFHTKYLDMHQTSRATWSFKLC